LWSRTARPTVRAAAEGDQAMRSIILYLLGVPVVVIIALNLFGWL
jgi:hypothetical protein